MIPSGIVRSAVLSLFGSAAFAFAQAPTTEALKTEIDSLRNEIQSLKQQQATVIQQLAAIQQYMQRQQQPQPPPNPLVSLKNSPVQGSPLAKVAIVEYTDYWCGFCARFAQQTMPEIVKQYIASG